MTHSAWWLTCDALAVYRLARLVATDTITEPVREWLRRRATDPHTTFDAGGMATGGIVGARWQPWAWLFDLVSCPLCVGVWIAAAVTALTHLIPGVWQWPMYALALAGAAYLAVEAS